MKLNVFDLYYDLIFADSLTTAKATTFTYLLGGDRGCPSKLQSTLKLLSESVLVKIL